MKLPALGEAVPRRGSLLSRALGRSVLSLLRWRIEGVMPDIPKCVTIVAPHTSNWDFPVGLAAILALGIDVRWLGKNTIFRPPFRGLLQWLGGIPVDRQAPADVVERAVTAFRERDRLFLALAPEGTRKKVERWKSGFYRIAQGAGVPILLASLDYRTRVAELGPLFVPTGDYAADLEAMQSRFTGDMARHPALYSPK